MSWLKLDDRDIRILSILSREGRISKAELANRVNLTPSPCWERLKRLEAAGIICGYRAEISLKQITPHVVIFVTVELESHRSANFQAFERAVAECDEIIACWAVGGGFDYLLQIVTRDIDSYQRLIDSLLAHGLGLVRYYTYVETKTVKIAGTFPFKTLLAQPDPKK